MKKKTYEVPGLMEFQMMLYNPATRLELRLEFTDGKITGYGVTPASFTTGDPVIQRLIEDCAWFRTGRIRLRPK